MEVNEAYYSHFFKEVTIPYLFTKMLPTKADNEFVESNENCFYLNIPINLN